LKKSRVFAFGSMQNSPLTTERLLKQQWPSGNTSRLW